MRNIFGGLTKNIDTRKWKSWKKGAGCDALDELQRKYKMAVLKLLNLN